MSTGYVALLRGINVGGRNIVSMADLRAVFEAGGYASVRTYIQSGNVTFASDAPQDRLERDLETMLARDLGRTVLVVVRSREQLREVVAEAPGSFGASSARKDDVMFLKAPLTAAEVMAVLELREGVDRAWPGPGVVYFSRDAERLTTSRMSRITGQPVYQRMTIRNWRTTTRLLDMLEDR